LLGLILEQMVYVSYAIIGVWAVCVFQAIRSFVLD